MSYKVDPKVTAALKAVEDKLVAARVSLINDPRGTFFGTLSLRLEIRPSRFVPTMGVDGRHLDYNPAWADALPFDELTGVMAHEVLHCGLNHHTRFNQRDHRTWNEACDHVVNAILREAGFALPSTGLSVDKPKYPGKSAEEIYAILWAAKEQARAQAQAEADEQDDDRDGDEDGESGDGGESEDDSATSGKSGKSGKGKSKPGKSEPEDDDQGGGKGKGQPKPKPESAGQGAGDDAQDDSADDGEGSGEDGESAADQPQADDVGGCGSFSAPREADGKPASEATLAEEQREWQVAVSQAAAIAAKAGNLPGSMKTLIETSNQAEVDWREQLRRFIDSATRQNYAWTPPNRRHIADGLYLPSVTNDGLGQIVFAIDTSASLDDASLKLGVDELNSVLADALPEAVRVIQCDERITEDRTVEANDFPLKVEVKGRGGTSFKPVFAAVAEMPERPACLIYFTDLMPCDGFPEEPDYPVLWCRSPRGQNDAPFGEVIMVLADGK